MIPPYHVGGREQVLLQNGHPTFVEHLGVQLAISVLTEAKEPVPKVVGGGETVDVIGVDSAL